LLDAFRNRPSVKRVGLERPEYQQIQRALEKIEA
jgi:hypothetical protein